MPFACKLCIISKGLKGSEIGSLPKTREELCAHIEREHHLPVRREDETEEQARSRFDRENGAHSIWGDVRDMESGDFVKTKDGTLKEIATFWGISPRGHLAKPSQGGFGIVTPDGERLNMWEIMSYHKKENVDETNSAV